MTLKTRSNPMGAIGTKYYTLTVSTTPANASCRLTYKGNYYYQKSLEVEAGSTVEYYVYYTNYTSTSGSWVINSDTTKSVSLNLQTRTITVNTTPSNASCTLTGNGTTTTNKSITVPYGTTVTYTVSATGYITKTGSWTVTSTETKNVSLDVVTYTLTVNPTPSDATVDLTYNGTTYSNTKSLTVSYNSTVSYSVSRTGYATQTGSWVINSDTTKNISLIKNNYTLTVTTYPSDASCTLTGNGITTTNKSITVPYNTSVSYTISKPGSTTQTGSWTVTSNTSKAVYLDVTLTVTTTPSDAVCKLTYNGNTYTSKTATVPYGTSVSYEISKTNYTTQTGTWIIDDTTTKSISLSLVNRTLVIYTDPDDAVCKLTYNGNTYTSKTATVPHGTTVSYEVSMSGYVTETGSLTMTSNVSKSIWLNVILTVTTIPSDASCILTGNGTTTTNKSITVPHNSTVDYTISKTNYITQTGSWPVAKSVTKIVTLSLVQHTLTVVTDPSDAVCKLTYNGNTYTSKTATVPYGTSVSYEISATNYTTQTGTWIIDDTTTKSISLALQNILTVVTDPSDAVCKLTYNGNTYTSKTATVDYGTIINYSITHSTFGTQTGTVTMDNNKTLTATGTYDIEDESWTSPNNLTSDTSNPAFIVSGTESTVNTQKLWHLFDGLTSTMWHATNGSGCASADVIITTSIPIKLKSFTFNTGSAYGSFCPTGGTVYDGIDGNYVPVVNFSDKPTTKNTSWSVTVNSSTYCNIHKINLTKTATAVNMEGGEIILEGYTGLYNYYWDILIN